VDLFPRIETGKPVKKENDACFLLKELVKILYFMYIRSPELLQVTDHNNEHNHHHLQNVSTRAMTSCDSNSQLLFNITYLSYGSVLAGAITYD
jgi:hypothetical protein